MALTPLLFGFLVAACIASLASFFHNSNSRIHKRLEVQTKPGRRAPADDSPAILPPALVDKFEKKLGLKKDGSKAKEESVFKSVSHFYVKDHHNLKND